MDEWNNNSNGQNSPNMNMNEGNANQTTPNGEDNNENTIPYFNADNQLQNGYGMNGFNYDEMQNNQSEKISKARIIVPVVAVIVAILAGACVFASGVLSPKSKVTKALIKTADNLEDDSWAEVLQTDKLKDKLSGSHQVELSGTIEEGGYYYDFLNDSQINVKGLIDVENKKALFDCDIKTDGKNLLVLKSYVDQNIFQLNSPQLYDKTISFDISGNYSGESGFLDNSKISLDEYNEKISQIKKNSFLGDKIDENQLKMIKNRLSEMAQPLTKEIIVEKGEKKNCTYKDEKVRCQGYKIIIPNDGLKGYLYDVKDYVKTEDDVVIYFQSATQNMAGLIVSSMMGYGGDLLNSNLDNDELQRQFGLIIGDYIDGVEDYADDIELSVYLKDGYIIYVEGVVPDSYGDETDYEIALQGGDCLTDNVRINLDDGYSKTRITKSEKEDDSRLKTQWIIERDDSTTNIDAVFRKEKGTFDLELSDDYSSYITISGHLNNTGDYELILDKIEMGEEEISGSIAVKVANLENTKIDKISGEEFAILDADKNEYEAFALSVAANMSKMVFGSSFYYDYNESYDDSFFDDDSDDAEVTYEEFLDDYGFQEYIDEGIVTEEEVRETYEAYFGTDDGI